MATIKKYEDGGPVTTTKKTTKKPKTASQRIGDLTLRDVKNAGEDALNLATVGLYSRGKRALGGKYRGKKDGGKVTKADILKGRGVIAKSGAKMKKCKTGCK